jgi:hypothetical protein
MRDHAAGPPAREVRGRPGGIGRSTSPAAEQVSDNLRRHSGGFLDQRRRISALALAGVGSLGVVAAYQTGVIRHVPGHWGASMPTQWTRPARRIGS